MEIIKNYERSGNKGTIAKLNNDNTFTATTATQTKDFKTLKGAEKFMTKYGYKEV